MRIARWGFLLIAVAMLLLSVINASWLAASPGGKLILVAQRGVAQPVDPGAARAGCSANIREPTDMFIENSLFSIDNAIRFGADAIAIDAQPSADGQIVLFRDSRLDCRTNGSGPVSARTLAELKTLDIGYGYTADGGRTFPLRGRGVGGMPSLEQVLTRFRGAILILNLAGDDPHTADLVAAAFARAAVPMDGQIMVRGAPSVLARMKQLAPEARTIDVDRSRRCFDDYLKLGWTTLMPESCRNTTVIVPLGDQWKVWGWPNRFIDRMTAAGTKVVLIGAYRDGDIVGLQRPEQIEKVPQAYRGYLWIEDMDGVGRALQP
ncbi:MAG: glycerophosphodiester phosphodiesterase family protein [Sphingomonadales bacterium]